MTSDNYFLSLQTAQNASDAATLYNESKKAKAEVPTVDRAPTAGKNVPIVLGAVKITGDVIWIRTYKNTKNECICDVAICFGRNPFGRPMKLMSLSQDGHYIYRREKGDVVDPPKTVRFYDGTQTEADPTIVKYEGETKTPAFKGYVYCVLKGVKLGDVTANFTDNGNDTAPPSSSECDPILSGLNLVYDETVRLYFGLIGPMSSGSLLVVSDGCKVLSMKGVVSPFDGEDVGFGRFWVENMIPIRCTGLVLLTGFTHLPNIDGYIVPEWWPVPPNLQDNWAGNVYSVIYDPWTGKPVSLAQYDGDATIRGGIFGNALAANSVYETVSPGSTGCDWEISYPLPGGLSAVIRTYDPSDCLATGPHFVNGPEYIDFALDYYGNKPRLATSKKAGLIFNTNTRDFDYWNDVGHSRTNYAGADSVAPMLSDYNVKNFPDVDEMIHCKTNQTEAIIGGVKKADNVATMYIIRHSFRGVSSQTVTITMPTDFTIGGMNFDTANEWLLIAGTAPDGGILSNRIYYVSILNLFTGYIVTSPGFSLIPRPYGVAGGGKAPVSNGDNSQIAQIDLQTGDQQTLYNGDPPSGQPVVDLNAQTFSIPTLTGMLTYNIGQVTANSIPVANILADCCALRGYDSGDLVFQNIASYSILGLLISSTIRMSDLFNRLGTLFGFTFVETDRKMKFLRKRTGSGFAVDAVLTEDDLVRVGTGDESPIRTINRAGANNMLGGLDLEFMNPKLNYENDTIKVRRPDGVFDIGSSTRIETLSVPITLDPDVAYAQLYESFYSSIHKQTRVAFTVMPHRALIEPGDCIRLEVEGVTSVGIAVRVVMREDFAQEIEMESCLEYGETQVDPIEYPPIGPTTPTRVYGEWIHIDIPYLSPADYTGRGNVMQYGGLTAADTTEWSGADLYTSTDGTNFTKVHESNSPPMAVAECSTVPSYAKGVNFNRNEDLYLALTPWAGDITKFLGRVATDGGEEAQTYVEQMNGKLMAAWGRPGAWELVSWRYASQDIDGNVTLWGIERGLYGTHKVFMPVVDPYSIVLGGEGNVHAADDKFCLIDHLSFVKLKRNSADSGNNEKYGVLTGSVGLDLAIKRMFSLTRRCNTMPNLANIRAIHEPGTTNVRITFDLCSQIAGGWPDSGAVNALISPVKIRVFVYLGGGDYEVIEAGTHSFGSIEVVSTIYGGAYGVWYNADTIPSYDRWIEIFALDTTIPFTDSTGYVSAPYVSIGDGAIREGSL